MKIGIFGGSFSPVHWGHINAALAFYDQVGLDKLYIMPSRTPPHKKLDADSAPQFRLDMLRLAFDERALSGRNIIISDFELERDTISYTVDTVEHFEREGELFLLCGTDMFNSLETWYRAERIFQLATIVLARREEDMELDSSLTDRANGYRAAHGARVVILPTKAYPISSSEIRTAIEKGEDTPHLPKSVEEYIHNKGLYGSTVVRTYLRQAVRPFLSEEKYAHSLSTEKMCDRLANGLKLTNNQRQQLCCGAILHDITKDCTHQEQLALCEKHGIAMPPDQVDIPDAYHAQTGAYIARQLFPHVVDEVVFHAIADHTCGRLGMGLISKLVFLADCLEEGRVGEKYQSPRQKLWSGIENNDPKIVDRVLLDILDRIKTELLAKGKPIASGLYKICEELKKALERN